MEASLHFRIFEIELFLVLYIDYEYQTWGNSYLCWYVYTLDINIIYPQLVSNTRSGRGMRCDEAPYYRSVSSTGAGRPRLTHHHKGWWNETKWMRWVWRNGGIKFVVGESGRNPEKNLPRPRFVHHETHIEWPRRELGTPEVGGERLTACATRPPLDINIWA